MENKPALVKQMTSPMIQKAFESLTGMKELAQEFLDSQIIPHHFYEKEGNKPNFSKGMVSKVVAVWIKGDQLQMHPMTALQEIVPVNGLLSIKGDGAKGLILKSGKIEPGSWKEVEEGSIESGDLKVTITAKRIDTLETLSRSFSVDKAKRAGLWVTEAQANGNDGWKYKKSAWYKYPERMIKYRALGFMARDLFPDVMNGTVTLEEAQDYPQDQTIAIEVGEAEIIIPDKNFNQERSENLTSKAIDTIEEKSNNIGLSPEILQKPLTKDEAFLPIKTILNGTEGSIRKYTEVELKEVGVDSLMRIIETDDLMKKAVEVIPGKNTNKKLRIIIAEKCEGNLVGLLEAYDPEDPESVPEQTESVPEQAESVPQPDGTNKYGIIIGDLPEGEERRNFEDAMAVYNEMADIAGIDNKRYSDLLSKFPKLQKYVSKEELCFCAAPDEINELLNSI